MSGQRQTVSRVLAVLGAIALTVVLSAWRTGPSVPNAAPPGVPGPDRAALISVRIPGQALSAPAAIAVAGGRVWIANSRYPMTGSASGWVTELSARTGALIRVISARADSLTDPEAIAADRTHVWVVNSSGDSITELDAATGALIKVITAQPDQLSDPGAITEDGNRLWVANETSNSVTELNATTGALIRVISGKRYQLNSGGLAVAIAADANRVWVPNANGDSVTELDARTGALIRVITAARYQLSAPVEVAASRDHVWVVSSSADNSSVTEINAATGALIKVISSLPNFAFGITPAGDGVWLITNAGVKGVGTTGPEGSIAELSATSGRLIRDLARAPFQASSPGGAIAADGTGVWVAGTNFYGAGGWVAELSAVTGAPVRVVSS